MMSKYESNNVADQLLQAQIEQLPKEMSPSRDLWQGIDKAIDFNNQQQAIVSKSKHTPRLAWAASVVAAVLITWLSVENYSPQTAGELTLAAQMNQTFEQERKLLLTSYGQANVNNLTPAMQVQLEQLKKARESLQKALIEDEHNADLINLLQWTQQQELDLLEKLYRPQWQSI